jgi:beta-glucanase (GH16 family)
VAIPAASPGWRLKFSDNFAGGRLNTSAWSVFQNHHGRRGPKLASNVVLHSGIMTLKVAKQHGAWSSAGMCACRVTTGTYGTYLLRARYGHGMGTRATALLWPRRGWPPEVDFMEFDARDPHHTQLMLTNHYNAGHRKNLMQHAFIRGDYTKWHTFGLVWTPSELRFTLDGRTTAVMRGHVPHQPMWAGIANSPGHRVRPNHSTPNPVRLDVDWFAYYVRR